ncbi:MAG: CcmD family protein [Flavobacteriales bacterium]
MKEVAQQSAMDAVDEVMLSNGKIYVVMGVALIILIGLFGYLFFTERKLNRIEKQLNK